MPTLPARDTSEEKGENPLLTRSQLTGRPLNQKLSICESCKGETYCDPPPAPRSCGVGSTAKVYRTWPTAASHLYAHRCGQPFYFHPLKRQGKPSGNTRHTVQPADLSHSRPPGKGQRIPVQAKTPENQCLGPCPIKMR